MWTISQEIIQARVGHDLLISLFACFFSQASHFTFSLLLYTPSPSSSFFSSFFPQPNEDEDEDLYVVVESFSSEREEFLTVKKGQLVEVLDQGGSNWLVLTIPAPGELETEGFLPAICLRPAGEGEWSVGIDVVCVVAGRGCIVCVVCGRGRSVCGGWERL